VSPKNRAVRLCCENGCQKPRWIYGRCSAHFRSLDPKLFKVLKNMSRAQRQVEFEKVSQVPECPKWEYTNDAGELALMKAVEKETETQESQSA